MNEENNIIVILHILEFVILISLTCHDYLYTLLSPLDFFLISFTDLESHQIY